MKCTKCNNEMHEVESVNTCIGGRNIQLGKERFILNNDKLLFCKNCDKYFVLTKQDSLIPICKNYR